MKSYIVSFDYFGLIFECIYRLFHLQALALVVLAVLAVAHAQLLTYGSIGYHARGYPAYSSSSLYYPSVYGSHLYSPYTVGGLHYIR